MSQASLLSFLESSTGTILVPGTATSVSTTTGALVVQGGAAVAGNLVVGGTVIVTGSLSGNVQTAVTSTNLAAGTAGQLHYQVSPGISGFTGPGTQNQVLVSNGTNAPTYQSGLNITVLTATNIVVTSTASSTSSYSANALYVAGGIGGNSGFNINGPGYLNGNLYVNGIITGTNLSLSTIVANSGTFYGDSIGNAALYAGIVGGTIFPQTIIQASGNYNGFMEINAQNTNAGAKASTDIVASADNVTISSAYIDMGIASSTFDGTQLYSLGQTVGPNDGYLMVGQNATPGLGDLVFGTTTAGTQMRFVVAATATTVTNASVVMIVNSATTTVNSTNSGALQVVGGVGINGGLFVGGTITATNFVGTFAGSIAGIATTATNIQGGTAGQVPYQTAAGATSFYGPGSYGQFLMSTGASAPVYQSTITQSNGNIVITSNTPTSSTATGSLQVAGGVGIGGGLVVGSIVTATNSMFVLGNTGAAFNTGALQVPNGGIFAQSMYSNQGLLMTNSTKLNSYQLQMLNNGGFNQDLSIAHTYGIYYSTIGSSYTPTNSGANTTASFNYIQGFTINNQLSTNSTWQNVSTLRIDAPTNNSANTTITNLLSIHALGAVKIESSITSGSTTTGALQVTGGVGVGGSLFVGGVVTATTYYGTFAGTIAATINTATNIAGGAAGYIHMQSAPGVTSFIPAGTAGQLLQSQGSTATFISTGSIYVNRATLADTATTATNAAFAYAFNTSTLVATAVTALTVSGTITTATNLAGGTAGQIHYQSAPSVTSFAGPGTLGQILVSAGAAAPVYTNTTSIYVGSSVNTQNLYGGTTGQLVYQSGASTTGFTGPGTAGQLLVSSGASAPTYTNTASIGVGFVSNPLTAGAGIGFSSGSTYNGSQAITISVNTGTLSSQAVSAQTVNTVQSSGASATYYIPFVSANNGSAAAMSLYTTSTFTVNPVTGQHNILGSMYIGGDLYVDGTQFTVNTNVIATGDKALVLSTGSTTALLASGAGLYAGASSGTAYTSFYYDGANGWIAGGSAGGSLMLGGATAPTSGAKLTVTGGAYINGTSTATTLVSTGVINGATGLNITGLGGFFNSANKFGLDNNSGASRLYSSGPNSSTRGTYEFHITDSVGTLDNIAMSITATGGLSFNGTGNYGTTGQVLQSNGNAAPTWVNASSITSGSTSLTNTYVGFGNASNLLTGSANLTWNGTVLAITGGLTSIGSSGAYIGDSSSKLWFGGSGGINYIESGNNAWSASANLAITGYNGATGGTCTVNFSTLAAGQITASVASGTTQGTIATFTNSTNAGYTAMAGAGTTSVVPTWSNGSQIMEFVPFSTGNGIISAYTGNLVLQTNGRTTALTITSAGGIAFGTSATAYGTSGQILQSNGNAAPTWVNASSITAGSASLTNTYVGFGSGSNTLTGSANLTWNGSTLAISGSLTSPVHFINRTSNVTSGISWYSSSYTAWSTYMAPAAQASSGPTGNITAPSGTYVTSWALRNFVENNAGYGWTWESGTSSQTAPTVVAEIRSSDGLFRNAGNIVSGGTLSLGASFQAGTNVAAGYYQDATNGAYRSIVAASTVNGYYFQTNTGAATTMFVGLGGAVNGYVGIGNTSPATQLHVTGQIYATSEITAYYSDRRLKTNVKPIENAVDKVLKLHGITYNPNDLAESFGFDKTKDIVGLFADEVEDVLPQAVKPAPFDQEAGGVSKSGENYKTVQYEKVVPLLVEAIKEQQAMIEELKAQIQELKSQK